MRLVDLQEKNIEINHSENLFLMDKFTAYKVFLSRLVFPSFYLFAEVLRDFELA